MSATQQDYVATQYAPRARDYVTSLVHSSGADLDQLEAVLQGLNLDRVLDLGCGGGHVSYRAALHARQVVACDVTPDMLVEVAKAAQEKGLTNIATQQAAAENLPFADGHFDAVLCRFTTHHWHDMAAGLREARRVCKPGGVCVFIDSVAAADRMLDTHMQAVELLRDTSHVRNYNLAEWAAGFAQAGFTIETLTMRRLRMDYPVWIARTRTDAVNAAAIRALQQSAPDGVKAHFAIDEGGSFDIEVVTFVVRAQL